MRLSKVLSVTTLVGLALTGSLITGCAKKVTKAECARLADKGADLKLDEDPRWARLPMTQQAAYKAMARGLLEKADSDLQQATRCDPGELTREEYECGVKSKTFNEWGACIN